MGSRAERRRLEADRLLLIRSKETPTMASSIATTATRILGRKPAPWTRPHFEMPMLTAESELRPLGEYRGRQWFTHRFGELEERAGLLRDGFDVLPNLPIVQVDEDGERRYRVFSVHAPGTLAAMSSARLAVPKPPVPSRPVDALTESLPVRTTGALPAADARTQAGLRAGFAVDGPRLAITTSPVQRRGLAAYKEQLRHKGVALALTTDVQRVIPSAPGGRLMLREREIVERENRLLAGDARGEPLPCEGPAHKAGKAPPAEGTAVGGAVLCGECFGWTA